MSTYEQYLQSVAHFTDLILYGTPRKRKPRWKSIETNPKFIEVVIDYDGKPMTVRGVWQVSKGSNTERPHNYLEDMFVRRDYWTGWVSDEDANFPESWNFADIMDIAIAKIQGDSRRGCKQRGEIQ